MKYENVSTKRNRKRKNRMHDNKTTVNHDKCGTPDCCGECVDENIVYTRQVFCADGHPHVYYYIKEETNTAVCGYCNKKWRYVEATKKVE